MSHSPLDSISDLIASMQWELARRQCLRLLQIPSMGVDETNSIARQLHTACRLLGDFVGARASLETIRPQNKDEEFEIAISAANDYLHFSAFDFYRASVEAKAGLTYEPYQEKYFANTRREVEVARGVADSCEQHRYLDAIIKSIEAKGSSFVPRYQLPNKSTDVPASIVAGTISGTISFEDDRPVANATVTLGLKTKIASFNLDTDLGGMGWKPTVDPLRALTTETNSKGCFQFTDVPADIHDFIAVTLDPAAYDITTRFLAQGIHVTAGKDTSLALTIAEWMSAPARIVNNPLPERISRNGVFYERVHEIVLKNPFYYNFPRQLLSFPVPPGVSPVPSALLLLASHEADKALPIQINGSGIHFFTDLPQLTYRVISLYQALGPTPDASVINLAPQVEVGGTTAIIDTGRACFRIAYGEGTDSLPPLIAVRGVDGKWRGQGRFRFPDGLTIISRKTQVLESGPLLLSMRIDYILSDKSLYSWILTAHQDEAYLLVRESSPDIEGAAFDFSLKEFTGGRGFLHWKREGGDQHWTDLQTEDRELARLQESVAWWLPPQGFGYAMTSPSLEEHDYIAVFTRNRGDWDDRKFERIAQGPGDANRELDWPYPEMVGSTISMITAHTDASGDAYFHLGFFEGERQWGILVSDIEENDGLWKELSRVQHKNSSPKLQDFKDWHLDEPDSIQRPFVVAKRSKLKALRQKKSASTFAPFWEIIQSGRAANGPAAGIYFAVDGNPLVAWEKKLEILYGIQMFAKMVLLGREYGDIYSPVGCRPIAPWAEDYDLIAPSGVFTSEEERAVRQSFILMGHMFMSTDLMNWKYNSRNANFESDRVDAVGTVGLCFHGNTDSEHFVSHGIQLMEKSLNVYCTPGSGRWYENIACYYLHNAKCRLNFAFHIYQQGIFDVTTIPRFKDYLKWGIITLTPNCPHSYEIMSNGIASEGYLQSERVRRVPPIGDHAHIGSWVPDHYATAAKIYRKSDPEFADFLLGAFNEGGRGGGYYGNAPLLFAALEEEDLRSVKLPELESRRLEGFGAVFRDHFGTDDEFYLLFKQGPDGYRYQRTEGSLILFAGSRPLLYDGGEAGDTWRHSTLSFYDVEMPLAPGHVERFHALPGLGFVQGVHPVAVKPELTDSCHHSLVEVAYQRYAEPNPVDVRSILVARDEYIIMHDDLHLDPSILCRWHLQVVSDSHTGNASEGYLFKGRHGVDMQVIFPGQTFVEEKVERLAITDYKAFITPKSTDGFRFAPRHSSVWRASEEAFATRHLSVRTEKPDHYLAVLRPLTNGRNPVQATALMMNSSTIGLSVKGDGIDDQLFLQREGISYEQSGIRFKGRYAAVLRRPASKQYFLLAGSLLEVDGLRLSSNGPAVRVEVTDKGASVTAEGQGRIEVDGLSSPVSLDVSGNVVTQKIQ